MPGPSCVPGSRAEGWGDKPEVTWQNHQHWRNSQCSLHCGFTARPWRGLTIYKPFRNYRVPLRPGSWSTILQSGSDNPRKRNGKMWFKGTRSNRIFWTGSWRFVGTDRPGLHRSLCCVGGCRRWGGGASSMEGHTRGLHSWVCSASSSPVVKLTNLSVLIKSLRRDW